MENLRNATPIIRTPPNLSGTARVDLVKKDFEAVVWGKSYEAHVEKAIKCPCINKPDGQPQVDCRNCGGTSWVFIDRTETKVVVQSLNIDTKFKEWSEEKLGTAKMTFLSTEKLTFMDRVVIRNASMLTSQVLYPTIRQDSRLVARTIYEVERVDFCFLFIDSNTKLTRLREGVDFEVENGQYIVFTDPELYRELMTITLRYSHRPSYHIVDIPRVVMTTKEFNKGIGTDVNSDMPLLATVRLSHYVLSLDTFSGDLLINNTDYDKCTDI